MRNKKTLVLGASTKPERYAYKAITMLVEKGHSVVAIGQNAGEVAGITIKTKNIPLKNIDTVTLYLIHFANAIITTTSSLRNPNVLFLIRVLKTPNFINC